MQEPVTSPPSPSALRFGKTLKFAIRESWDALGLLCAASLTLFIVGAGPIYLAFHSLLLGAAVLVFVLAPFLAGACLLAHRVYMHDEPSYLDLWYGYRRLLPASIAVGIVQALGIGALLANVLFYSSRGGFGFLVLSVAFIYLLIFWLMNCLYHFPLLIAADQRIVVREDEGPARLRSVFRNAFLLAVSSPGYSFAVLAFIMAVEVPLIASGVGLALIGMALPAFVSTRAARDHLIRLAMIPPDPDPDEPLAEEMWKLPGRQ